MSVSRQIRKGLWILCVAVLLQVGMGILVKTLGIGSELADNGNYFFKNFPLWFAVIFIAIIGPFLEEVQYRLFPIFWITKTTSSARWLWTIMALSSFVWAWEHGPTNIRAIFFFVPLGILFSWAYLKYGFFSCLTAHIMLNTLVTFRDIFGTPGALEHHLQKLPLMYDLYTQFFRLLIF